MHCMKFAGLLAGVAFAPLAFAQQWTQPWYLTSATRGPSFLESWTYKCPPLSVAKMAMVDDFDMPANPISGVEWWGGLSNPTQRLRKYNVTFYRNTPGGCAPFLQGYKTYCVKATGAVAGYDCSGNKIWRLRATLPTPFQAAPGLKYWIQISEVDASSVTLGANDFGWAFHKRSPNYASWTSCKALGFDAALNLFNVTDPCDSSTVDLAFNLY